MVELFFNRIILRIQHMTPDCTRQRVPMFFFQRRVTRKTTSSRATETCAFIAKKTKTNPRVKASKSERCWRGAFIWLCIIQSSAQRQRDRAVIFLLILLMTLWVGTLTIAKEKCVCMCITMNSCPAMCGLCFIGCEFSSGNLITMLCIPLDFLFFFISLYMCIILVHEFWMLTTSHFGLVHGYMELFENFDTGMIIFQVSCWKFFLKDLVPFCLHELFYHSCETHREIMCCTRKLYRLILYEYFIWIENIEASMQIDNPALHVLHVVLSQIF